MCGEAQRAAAQFTPAGRAGHLAARTPAAAARSRHLVATTLTDLTPLLGRLARQSSQSQGLSLTPRGLTPLGHKAYRCGLRPARAAGRGRGHRAARGRWPTGAGRAAAAKKLAHRRAQRTKRMPAPAGGWPQRRLQQPTPRPRHGQLDRQARHLHAAFHLRHQGWSPAAAAAA